MKHISYSPLFTHLKRNQYPKYELVMRKVISNDTFDRILKQQPITTKSLLAIMEYLNIDDIHQVIKIVNVKDNYPVIVRGYMVDNKKKK